METDNRPMGMNGARCAGQRRGLGGRARKAKFLAQAQVAAWARGECAGQRERADVGPSWAAAARAAGRAALLGELGRAGLK